MENSAAPLRIVEFRIPMPLTADEYQIGSYWSYLHAVELQQRSNSGTGIKQHVRQHFEDADAQDPRMEEGWKREKTNFFGSHLPAVLRGLAPEGSMSVNETSWDCFPYRKSIFRSDYLGDSFHLEVEQMILEDDRGEHPNALNLSPEHLNRPIEYIDIQADEKTGSPLEGDEDILTFKSEKTGRGPLKEEAQKDFHASHDPILTIYVVAKLRLVTPILQSTAEDLLISWGIRDMMLAIHRRTFCLIDKWHGITMEQLDAYEEEVLMKK